jgi:hypothetical protein
VRERTHSETNRKKKPPRGRHSSSHNPLMEVTESIGLGENSGLLSLMNPLLLLTLQQSDTEPKNE